MADTRDDRYHYKYRCLMCNREKDKRSFYKSYEPWNKAKIIPCCKTCLDNESRDINGEVTKERLISVLKLINKPFLIEYWDAALVQGAKSSKKPNLFGMYMKNMALPQNKDKTYMDSIIVKEKEPTKFLAKVPTEFKEIVGNGYDVDEYEAMYKKYIALKDNYKEVTAMHTEALITYIRYRVKEEFATAKGDVSSAEKWGKLAENAAQKAKISPSQLSKNDLQDGINNFSEVFNAVEEAKDITEILPKYKDRPQDKVDFTIFCYMNAARDLKGLPLCEYSDIHKFYEVMKKEHNESFTKDFELED
jgi:hypothetical protein